MQKGIFVSEEDRTISLENSAKLEERFFEVTMMIIGVGERE